MLLHNFDDKNRWQLAQDCQKANQLNKKSKMITEDFKPFLIGRYKYASALIELVKKYKEVNDTSRILELGSGPHGISFFYPIGIRVALDPLALFYHCEFTFIQEGTNALIVQGMGERLPFPSKTFDCVVSDNVIDHTSNAREILFEIYRVLKDDGLFLLTVNLHHWAYKVICTVFNMLFSLNIILNFPNFKTHTYFFTPAMLKQMLKRSGFEILFADIPIPRTRRFLSNKGVISLKPFNHILGKFVCSKSIS